MIIPDTIFFDLDNTLVDHGAALEAGLKRTYESIPGMAAAVEFSLFHSLFDTINESLWNEYMRGEITAGEMRRRRMAMVLDEIAATYPDAPRSGELDVDELAQHYVQSYLDVTIVYDGVPEMLAALAGNRVLGIITNGFMSMARHKLAAGGIAEHFSHAIFSEEFGAHKPDPRIFLAAAELAGVDPRDVLYVGDSFVHDIHGAAGVGMKTVWFNPRDNDHPREHSEIRPDAVARSIPELAAILGVTAPTHGAQ